LTPNTDLVKGLVACDPGDFLETDQTLMCSVPGLFAAGLVRAGSTKQAASAAGEGASAAIINRKYLERMGEPVNTGLIKLRPCESDSEGRFLFGTQTA
jgi:thioredoxin reductase (NADPH)